MKRLIFVIIAGLLSGVAALLLFVFSGGDNTEAVSEPDTSRPAPSFDELHQNLSEMTEAQWENFAEEAKGAYVENLPATVNDVDQTLGTYTVILNYNDNPNSRIRVTVSEDEALTYEKDQNVAVSGNVKLISVVLDSIALHLENATITTE